MLIDECLDQSRDLLLLRPWEFGGRFKQAAHPASRPDGGASLLLRLTQQFIHRNTHRPRHRRSQPHRNVARLAFIERERALWNAERFGHRRVVEEVTDDKRLPEAERKRLQIEYTSHLSESAK